MSGRVMTSTRPAGIALIAFGLLILVGPAALVLVMRRMYTTGLSFHGSIGFATLACLGMVSITTGVWLLRSSRAASLP